MPRVYARKFDWDEARRLRAEGLGTTEIGRRLGVSYSAVYFACNEEARQRNIDRLSEWQRAGTCPDCGGPATRVSGTQHRCWLCAAKRKAKVRDGKAYCPTCDTWKPLKDFSPSRQNAARGVHTECRSCDTARRRRSRQRARTAA